MIKKKRSPFSLVLACVRSTLCFCSFALSLNVSAQPSGVSALGFIEPEGGVVNVSGSPAGGSILSELRVKEGDYVEAGQVIAVLSNHDTLKSSLEHAKSHHRISEILLDQLLAGPREGLIAVQQARISQLVAKVATARNECIRLTELQSKGISSQSELERKCLDKNTLEPALEEAEAQLADLKDIRSVDVDLLRARVDDAAIGIGKAKSQFETSLVRSPIDAQVLRVFAQPGETVHGQGIVGLGHTAQMWIKAEIYESEINRVAVGQTVVAMADGIDEDLQGEVVDISLMVGRNQIVSLEPTSNVDARVIEIKIRLDKKSSERVKGLTNMQVGIIIKE